MEYSIHDYPEARKGHPGDDAKILWKVADEEEFVNRVAKECFIKIDGAGGIGCTREGKVRVVERMLKLLNDAPLKQVVK